MFILLHFHFAFFSCFSKISLCKLRIFCVLHIYCIYASWYFLFCCQWRGLFSTRCKIHESFPLFLFLFLSSHIFYCIQLSHLQTNLIFDLKNHVSAAYLAFPAYISQSFLCMSPWKVNPSKSGWYLIHMKGKKSTRINHNLSFYHNILFLLFRH